MNWIKKNWKIVASIVLVLFFVGLLATNKPRQQAPVSPTASPEMIALKAQLEAANKKLAELQKPPSVVTQPAAVPASAPVVAEKPENFEQELQALERKTFGNPKHQTYKYRKDLVFDIGSAVRVMTRDGLVEAVPVLAPNGSPLMDTGMEPPLKKGLKAYRMEVASASGGPGGGWTTYWFAK